MYPPDKENEQGLECNVCGAPEEMAHHPNCPVATGEEIFIMDADIINIMTNAITKSAMEYMKKLKEGPPPSLIGSTPSCHGSALA